MLLGKRIYLRTIDSGDFEIINRWENSPEYWTISGTQVPFSKDLILAYVHDSQDIYQSKQVRFIICLLENDKPIGHVDLFDFEPHHSKAGVGILIVKTEQRKGYAKEALKILKNYCIQHLGLRNLYCNIIEDNEASIHLFETLGFEKIGLQKDWIKEGYEWKNVWLLQCLLNE